MHISIPIENTIQFIDAVEVTPLISKVQIKVCYTDDKPNRNGSVLTHDVVEEMGRKLPGSPIVGYYNKETEDFDGHSRAIEVEDGELVVIDLTKPYGFVDVNAKVWFQKFLDDNSIEREYLVTEGYIWTNAYPEAQRIVDSGENQSMELTNVDGKWAKDFNTDKKFFIINEAIIEKLCILGQDIEPCFEGAQIKSTFSLEQEFEQLRNTMYSMINDFNTSKGGSDQMEMEEEILETAPASTEENFSDNSVETETVENENITEETSSEEVDNSENFSYNIEEDEKYISLNANYSELQTNYANLEQSYNALLEEVNSLREFKLSKDNEAKKAMIDSFYVLSDEDKADVIEHMEQYTLDDIEAKLAVICVRKKVNFNLDEEAAAPEVTFSLSAVEEDHKDEVPDWVKSVKEKM